MRQTLSLIVAVCLVGVSGSARAATNLWMGANTANGPATDIDNASNWSLGWVPKNGDTAVFVFANANTNYLAIGPGSAFAPSALAFNGGAFYPAAEMDITVDKALTLSNLVLNVGNGVQYYYDLNRLRIGTLTSSIVTLTLTGNGEPLNISGDPKGSWGNIQVGQSNVVIDLTGSNITFSKGRQDSTYDTISGGVQQENAACTANSTLRFSGEGATITLKEQGVRGAALGCGFLNLAVKTNQTWTADPDAYVQLYYRNGAATAGPDIIRSLDGGRLDNLGTINLCVRNVSAGNHSSQATGMRLPGGTYGGLLLGAMGVNNSMRHDYFVLKDDVALQGRAVLASGTTNAATAYSLILESGWMYGFRSYWHMDLDGHNLALSNGLCFRDTATWYLNGSLASAELIATGSVVTVGGDLVIYSLNASPLGAALTANLVGRGFGIWGDAATIINLGGNYSNNCRSLNNQALSQSTVNLIGGAGVKQFEVGDAASSVVPTSGFALAALNIGNGTTAGNVQLVNNCLNDNPLVASNISDRIGEKLMVGTLALKAASTLDVNAQGVHIQTALTIAPDAWLDLHTGVTLEDRADITNFYGIGNQAAAWAMCRAQVKDSSNPGLEFVPDYVVGDNRTYWRAVPPQGPVFRMR